ncbi:uncharacterized protein L199_003125 [Kwoniella botswanensis]|uniref:uncharacterized protein n=1 Tax=Kwoniella botswanensis TaxID=1268659 RepID=UPI00315D8571
MLSVGNAIGFEAWVEERKDKIRLKEYQVTHHPAKGKESAYTECFLETVDQPFRIQISRLPNLKDHRDIRLSPYIDGNLLLAKAWLKDHKSCQWDHIVQKQEQGKRETIKSSLYFTPLPTTDDRTKVTISPETLRTLGTIEIVLEVGSYKPTGYEARHTSKLDKKGTIHEKTKKLPYAISAVNGEQYELPRTMHYIFTPAAKGSKLYRFLFKYRPRPALVFLKVIDEPAQSHYVSRVSIKRKSSSVGEAIEVVDDQEGEPNPSLQAKRVKYLEEQVRRLSSQHSQSLEAARKNDEIIDITSADDV